MNEKLQYKLIKPDKSLSDFVYCFSSLQNLSSLNEGVIIPNGRVDLIFTKTIDNHFQISLVGLESKFKYFAKTEISTLCSVGFNPIAVEYILRDPIADILNSGKVLPNNFWNFSIDDLNDFDAFVQNVTQKIQSLLPKEIDERKQKLFELIFASNGEISVQELSEKVYWSARQINRYFTQQFGLTLKAYCNILRFQASLPHIKKGELFPQLNFTDQSHFIKETKKLSGVSPKELHKNKNDRFLQFLVPFAK